jgi:hypothetical protein
MFSDLVLKDSANVRDVKIGMKSEFGDIPRCVGHGSEDFGSITLDDRKIRLGGTLNKLKINSASGWFHYTRI